MCRKLFYLIKIHGQLININEVTDFHGGLNSQYFLLYDQILDGLLYRAHEYLYMRKKYLTIPMDFLTIFYLKNLWTTH